VNRLERLREDARTIFAAAVAAADPARVVREALEDESTITGHRRLHLLAIGKAACAMAEGALATLSPSLLVGEALIVTNRGNAHPVAGARVLIAGHPLPDRPGAAAAGEVVDRLKAAGPDDLVLVLLSGGSSSLLPAPVAGISLEDKARATQTLLGSGAGIAEVNTVRKHLSLLKGGGMARLAHPASLYSLILSDVPGDDPGTIGSGPTVPDSSTYADALSILDRYRLSDRMPGAVMEHLRAGAEGGAPETVKPDDPVWAGAGFRVLGGLRTSLQSAQETASRLGYVARIVDDCLGGEARRAGEELATMSCGEWGSNAASALIWGGETAVVVGGPGSGGRNQELALAFALAAERAALKPRWVLLSAGTDGVDGNTDAAGGIVDPGTVARIRSRGLDPARLLAANDSYRALTASGDLLVTGSTGTNVADVQILLLAGHP
jgi:hydroxypyruvate reductase